MATLHHRSIQVSTQRIAGLRSVGAGNETGYPTIIGMAILSARVATDGTLVIGSGTSGQSLKPGTGTYQVFFDRDVSGCVYAATPYYTMQASAEGLAGAANGVLVNMTNSAGALMDGGFDLIVYCAQ